MRQYLTTKERMDALPASVYQSIMDGFKQEPREPLKAGKIFYMNSAFKSYAKNITYEVYTAEGEAAIVAAGSKDIPIINDYVTDVTVKVVAIKLGIVISDDEQQALADGNGVFNTARTEEIMYQVNRKIDKVIFEGSTLYHVPGILQATGTKTYTFPKKISLCTGFELLEALRALKSKTEEDEAGWSANVLMIPSDYKPYFMKGIDPTNTKTVMSQIMEEGLFQLVEAIPYLKGTDIMWAADASKANMEVAMVQMPTQLNTFVDEADNIQINYGGKTAGVMIYHKQALTKVTQP